MVTFLENNLIFPVDLKMHIIYEPATALLGTESQDILTYVQENKHMVKNVPGLSEFNRKNARDFTHISIDDLTI